MKRARTAFRSGVLTNPPEGEQGFWPSFADMMSSFALILFFLMLIAYLQNLITGNQLISTQDKLAETELLLSTTRQEVETATDELALLTVDLKDSRESLALLEGQIDEYAALLTEQGATISEQEALIAEQADYISLTTEELTKLRSQMTTIALLRLSILEQIRDSIGETLGSTSSVSIGENGSIILSEGLFFDYNSAKIKTDSHALLNKLTEAFVRFLSDPENAQYVDSIVISGHTDNSGAAARNRSLSTERANAVLNYLLEQNNAALSGYAAYFCAAGYGATRPVAGNDTAEGRSANRRIEISIILRDETVLDIVNAYLAQDMPTGATPTPSPAVPTPTPAA